LVAALQNLHLVACSATACVTKQLVFAVSPSFAKFIESPTSFLVRHWTVVDLCAMLALLARHRSAVMESDLVTSFAIAGVVVKRRTSGLCKVLACAKISALTHGAIIDVHTGRQRAEKGAVCHAWDGKVLAGTLKRIVSCHGGETRKAPEVQSLRSEGDNLRVIAKLHGVCDLWRCSALHRNALWCCAHELALWSTAEPSSGGSICLAIQAVSCAAHVHSCVLEGDDTPWKLGMGDFWWHATLDIVARLQTMEHGISLTFCNKCGGATKFRSERESLEAFIMDLL
jgi:hypothetical protein